MPDCPHRPYQGDAVQTLRRSAARRDGLQAAQLPQTAGGASGKQQPLGVQVPLKDIRPRPVDAVRYTFHPILPYRILQTCLANLSDAFLSRLATYEPNPITVYEHPHNTAQEHSQHVHTTTARGSALQRDTHTPRNPKAAHRSEGLCSGRPLQPRTRSTTSARLAVHYNLTT